MHEAIAQHLRKAPDLQVATATLDEPEHGCTERRLAETDVLTWWGHMAHGEVRDADRRAGIQPRDRAAWALSSLHSGHFSKIFRKLMGTSCELKWRVGEDREILWVTGPGHPIVQGIDDHFVLPREEMYGEYFDVPEPRRRCSSATSAEARCFAAAVPGRAGAGRIFYFRPGHETYPTYYDPNVLRVIENAVRWAAPTWPASPVTYGRRTAGWIDAK